MAANKFATMLHRNTHKITVILVYAVLEWILITLLLLNSLFTYLISKFAAYFGLKPPCLWCSRVDHILEPGNKDRDGYRDLVCETHATEISKLSYCSNHQRLAESHNMCADCLASQPNNHNERSNIGLARRIGFLSWVSQDKLEDHGDQIFRCSCCNETLSHSTAYPPCFLLKPFSWGGLSYTKKGNLIIEVMNDDDNNEDDECKEPSKAATQEDHDDERVADEHQILSDVESFSFREVAEEYCSRSSQSDEKEANEDEKASGLNIPNGTNLSHQSSGNDSIMQCCLFTEDNSFEIIDLRSQNYISTCDLDRLFPVELIDSSTTASQRSCKSEKEDLIRDHECQNETFDAQSQEGTLNNVSIEVALVREESAEMTSCVELENSEMGTGGIENSTVLNAEERELDLVNKACDDVNAVSLTELSDSPATKEEEEEEEEEIDAFNLRVDPTKSENLESNEVYDHADNELQPEEPVPSMSCPQPQEDPSSMNDNENGAEHYDSHEAFIDEDAFGQKHMEIDTQERTTSVDKSQEVEEEKFPETPTSVEGLHYLQKKLLLFDKREFGTEESLDGSVISETECGDSNQSIEQMKTALKAERKALSAIYAELEEERSASAIAAHQTMAMITRLQEEKAAMQMEALQYQRMMEEQSEYDQEALQLLNELMVKREKEKQELENELEIYRRKVLEYEAREKLMMGRTKNGSTRSRNSSASSSQEEECDELSIDLNRETRVEDSFYEHQESNNNNSPTGAVLSLDGLALDCVKHIGTLDVSLTEFEEERQAILEQLKTLEEKLFTVGDEQFFEDLKSIENLSNLKQFEENYDLSSPDQENGIPIEPSEDSEEKNYHERKTMGSMAKSLLPLLDAADNEIYGSSMSEEQVQSEALEMLNSLDSRFEMDSKKLAFEEEVDHVYERLQALEADREFLKHCMSSIKKGDKGVDLLQEILQHLRDLRTVDLQIRNMSDDLQAAGEVALNYHE